MRRTQMVDLLVCMLTVMQTFIPLTLLLQFFEAVGTCSTA